MKQDYRYEIKFVLEEADFPVVERWMVERSDCSKSYPDRRVNSIYFDNVNFSSIRDNLAGVSDRVKNRLRWYGTTCKEVRKSPVLEQKIRNGRLGSKISTPVPSLKRSVNQERQSLILKKIKQSCKYDNYFLTDYFIPTLYVSYSRKYFESCSGLRVTIDSDILFSRLQPNKSIDNSKKVPYSKKIVEIKFNQSMKEYVSNLLRDLPLTPRRHSKYLVGMAKFNEVQYF